MFSLKKILKSTGIPAQRGVYNGRDKPKAYYTFLRLLRTPIINADDSSGEEKEVYRVTLFHKGDFEDQLDKTLKILKEAGAYIKSVDAENYETDTGYWMIPITIEILRESENMTIGLKDLYYAKMSEQDGAETYADPKKLAEAMNVDLSVTVAEGKLYADDAISEDVKEFVKGLIKLGIKDLLPEVMADILGQDVDEDKVVWAGGDDEPPFVAIGFRAKKTGGRYRYIWLMKCKFKVPNEKFKTKGETIEFNTPEIEGDFYANKKGKWKADLVALETDKKAAHWFDAVPEFTEGIKTA